MPLKALLTQVGRAVVHIARNGSRLQHQPGLSSGYTFVPPANLDSSKSVAPHLDPVTPSSSRQVPMSAPSPEKRDVLISKSLSYLLRHGAVKEKLSIDSRGWVPVSEILAHNRLRTHRASEEDVRRVVAQNAKQRFSLETRGAQLFVCANQGHTLAQVEPELERLTRASMPPAVYHGTYRHKMAAIRAGGLSRMARNHIHLTSAGAALGIRANCNVLIFLDTDRCLADGYEFYRSRNGVILCGGNAQGCIPAEYFSRVENVAPGQNSARPDTTVSKQDERPAA